jgi:cell division septation protein DedD
MSLFVRRSVTGLLVVTGAFVGCIALGASPASAHQPVILDENDNSPERGPELVDGTVSFAVYGSITKPGDLRGLTFNLKVGDPIVVDLLIPNLEPELSSPLPSITVLDPDGNPTDPPVAMGDVFNESFSRTSYRYLAKLRSSATKAGRYGVVVGSARTGRFVIGIGDREVRGEVKQDDAKGSLASWYSSPVAVPVTAVAPVTNVVSTTTAGAATTTPAQATTTVSPPSTVAVVAPATRQPTTVVVSATIAKDRSSPWRVWFIAIPIVALVSLFLVARRRGRRSEQSKAHVRR